MEYPVLIVLFHLLVFRRIYFVNPYHGATSEALEQAFPSWIHLGRMIWIKTTDDPFYYPCYRAIPFLSSFYPPHFIGAAIGYKLPLDAAWILFTHIILAHYLFCALVSYYLLSILYNPIVSTFGAIAISYMGYSIKQNSCIVYSLAWIPVAVLGVITHQWLLCSIAIVMSLLAGYWPIALYGSVLSLLLAFFY